MIEAPHLRAPRLTAPSCFLPGPAAIGLLPGSTISALVAMAVFGATYMTLTIVVFFAALRLSPT